MLPSPENNPHEDPLQGYIARRLARASHLNNPSALSHEERMMNEWSGALALLACDNTPPVLRDMAELTAQRYHTEHAEAIANFGRRLVTSSDTV